MPFSGAAESACPRGGRTTRSRPTPPAAWPRRKGEALTGRLRQHGVTALGGARRYLEAAGRAGLKRAVVSASASTLPMLELAGLATLVEARVDADVIGAGGTACTARSGSPARSMPPSRRPARGNRDVHAQPGRRRGWARGRPTVIGVGEGTLGETLVGFGAQQVIPSVSALLGRALSPPSERAM